MDNKEQKYRYKNKQFLSTNIRILGLIILLFSVSLIITILLKDFNLINIYTVVILFVLLCFSICILLYHILLKPLNELVKALLAFDFESNIVDFTAVDRLEPSGGFDMQVLGYKFKYLVDIIAERITKYNDENYRSEHDGLSGCYNRVHLDRVKSQYENQQSTFIIFIDVNNLKKMNDIYGHEAGDNLIKSAANALSFWNSHGDVYRMGGDEFMIVLSNKNFDYCAKLLNGWYPTVGLLNNPTDGFKCVLSYGVACCKGPCNFDNLQKEADEAMYHMKVRIKKQFGEPMR